MATCKKESKDKLQEYLEMGGEIHIGMQRGKYLLSTHAWKDGQEYHCGVYFKDQKQLLAYMEVEGDYMTSALRALQHLKGELNVWHFLS